MITLLIDLEGNSFTRTIYPLNVIFKALKSLPALKTEKKINSLDKGKLVS